MPQEHIAEVVGVCVVVVEELIVVTAIVVRVEEEATVVKQVASKRIKPTCWLTAHDDVSCPDSANA